MAGLIFANLGKGLADVGRDIGKQAFQLELMRLEEEKALRLDEIKRDRDITSAKRKIEEVDPLQTASDANRTKVVGAAETSVLADRENALRPGKVETAKQTGLVAGEVERSNLAAYAEDPAARSGVRAKTSDSETSGSKATAAVANFELGQKKKLTDILEQLDRETDPAKRAQLEERFMRLSGGKYASRYQAVKVMDADGNEVTEILDKQTGTTSPPRRAPAAGSSSGSNTNRPPLSQFNK